MEGTERSEYVWNRIREEVIVAAPHQMVNGMTYTSTRAPPVPGGVLAV